jgi:acyl-CoA thioesterase I
MGFAPKARSEAARLSSTNRATISGSELEMRICFFGDSFTNGSGDPEGLGWVGRAALAERRRGADLTTYNLGVRRDTSADILARWPSEAEARLPQGCNPRLVFAFGNNDVAYGEHGAGPRIDHEKSLANASAILARAAQSAPTLVVSPVPVFDDRERRERLLRLSAGLSSLCWHQGLAYLDLVDLPEAIWGAWRREAQAGDGVHPGAEGYGALAENIVAWSAWRAWFD